MPVWDAPSLSIVLASEQVLARDQLNCVTQDSLGPFDGLIVAQLSNRGPLQHQLPQRRDGAGGVGELVELFEEGFELHAEGKARATDEGGTDAGPSTSSKP
jgi:hypothetical protein